MAPYTEATRRDDRVRYSQKESAMTATIRITAFLGWNALCRAPVKARSIRTLCRM